MSFYEKLDHTADIGIKVTGRDHSTLFQNAARAMFEEMAVLNLKNPPQEFEKFVIQVAADNWEELLVGWLSDLLSQSDASQMVFTDFQIESLKSHRLQATVQGAAREHFQMTTEIKAVTYHDLKIAATAEGLRAQIIFDV